MDNSEIEELLNNSPTTSERFLGVFSSDTLPQDQLKVGTCLVVNTDPVAEPGSHWVAVFKRHGVIDFFDPLGNPPDHYSGGLSDYFLDRNYVYNSVKLQVNSSESCGWFCVYFLYNRCLGYCMESIVHELFTKETNTNEFILDLFKLSYI